ncbi:FAD-dependent oxidoreductase [Devosia faecipullorum]|uniref:FAD-dependent oxidoreductase n=1 Tax=Devosia faecipullorum TaxID=2755039 RepID=UPI00187B4EA4|nr:FAD-dependent oxidoreductase [Devosia faecipullorum]MBE7733255.1 FAD-dependent oxidoreductase [Devosia faecipullorum]
MTDQIRPDLCIVGAGALGIALAQYAKGLGARVTLVDRGEQEPGDGPQQSLRLAALQASAACAHALRHAGEFGLANADPKVRMKAVQERAAVLAAEQAPMTSRDRLTALGIEIVGGAAAFQDSNSLLVGGINIRPRGVILALGASPFIPAIPGLDRIDYFTPDSILENNRKLTHLLVIGGDAAALSLAQALARLGSEVTLVPQGGILPGCDAEITAMLVAALTAEGVRIVDGGSVREILPRAQGTGAVVDLASGESEALDLSHVLVAMGRSADLSPLQPEKARLRVVSASSGQYGRGVLGETSNRRVRLVGAAAGFEQWNHALAHGRAVVETALFGAPLEKLAPQPFLVLTDPPLAQIGRLAAPAKRDHGGHLLRASLVENEQARALGVSEGLVKVVLASDGQIKGAGLIGPGALEMAALLALAMEKRLGLASLARLSLPSPNPLDNIVALGAEAAALRPVSPWTRRWRQARRWGTVWNR